MTNTTSNFSRVLQAAAALSLGLCTACPEEKAPAPKECCEQPKIPAGVAAFRVVGDDVKGPSDGQNVVMKVALGGPVARDALYPVLHTLYRFAMTRGPFEPINFTAEVFANESEAKAGGRVLGKIGRAQSAIAPTCENAVPYTLDETVARAFAALRGQADEEDSADTCKMAERKKVVRVDDAFTHKPAYKLDTARKAVEVTWPFLELGKDEYLAALTFNTAMRDWIDVTSSFFRKVPDLGEVKFIGLHNDAPALTITVSRADFDGQLRSLQEDIAAHAAVTFQTLGMKKTDDKGAMKEQETFKTKTYKASLALLPKGSVSVSPKLK